MQKKNTYEAIFILFKFLNEINTTKGTEVLGTVQS